MGPGPGPRPARPGRWAERRTGGGVQARAPGPGPRPGPMGPWAHDIIVCSMFMFVCLLLFFLFLYILNNYILSICINLQ